MRVPFLDLQAQYQSLQAEIDDAIRDVLKSAQYVLGPAVEQFETAFAAYCGATHCVCVHSGTSALTLALRAAGIGEGDDVILPAHTFVATAEAVSHAGANPILVDCNLHDALIDPSQVAAAVSSKTKAIIPVHMYGLCADMDAIHSIAKQRNLVVIEDACQAHGALYKGKKAGSMGDAAAFSFYPGKNLGAYGEGGGVLTNNQEIAQRVQLLRNHGSAEKYHHEAIGWNERMDGLQGAVLLVKLGKLDAWNQRRREHVMRYRKALEDIVRFVGEWSDAHAYHLCVIRSDKRDALRHHLQTCGVDTAIHYPRPIHLQPAYAHLGLAKGSFPTSEQLADEILSLPLFPEMTEEQIDYVCASVRSFAG